MKKAVLYKGYSIFMQVHKNQIYVSVLMDIHDKHSAILFENRYRFTGASGLRAQHNRAVNESKNKIDELINTFDKDAKIRAELLELGFTE